MVRDEVRGARIRGLKVTMADPVSNIYFGEAEFLVLNDEGISHLARFIHKMSTTFTFIKLKISGDKHMNNFHPEINIGAEGCQALA